MKVLAIYTNWNSFSNKPPHICIIKSRGTDMRYSSSNIVWVLKHYGYTRGKAIRSAINRYIDAVYSTVKAENNIRRSING